MFRTRPTVVSVGELVKERQILDGKYVVLRPLGDGAIGSLFEAENLLLGKRVAIKTIHPQRVAEPDARQRVLEQARRSALLEHPNICAPLDLGENDGIPYIVTEMLSGPSGRREIETSAPLPVPLACDLVLQVLAALDYAHANGVIHGGLHPQNVHVTYPRPGVPWVKVTDFGLAAALGCPIPSRAEPFLAPESGQGPPLATGDVYAAAALLFALLHGTPPGTTEPESSAVPAAVQHALTAALRSNPDQRTRTAESLASQLAAHTPHLPSSGEFRLSVPVPSIRWLRSGAAPASSVSRSLLASRESGRGAGDEPPPRIEGEKPVSDSLLRNPRFPSNPQHPWARRSRQLRLQLSAHPNLGLAWLIAFASLGAGIASAVLASWL